MGLVYVSGISGAGKSEVCRQLSARGYLAFGTDEADISAWYENATGHEVGKPHRNVWKTRQWQAEHTWRMSRERLEQIETEVGETTAFICGTASNENEVWDLFSTVICLYLDEETELRRRIEERTSNAFGKEAHELDAILGWNARAKQNYIGFGAKMVDASQPLDKVVADVLAASRPEGTTR